MRWPNAFTASLDAFCSAIFPSSTSALFASAAFFINWTSVADGSPFRVLRALLWPESGSPLLWAKAGAISSPHEITDIAMVRNMFTHHLLTQWISLFDGAATAAVAPNGPL